MAVTIAPIELVALDPAETAALAGIPAAVVSDVMNRARAMDAGMRAIGAAASFVGVAMTVAGMVGDNAALHHAAALARPGLVLVGDGRGDLSTALWGEILHRVASHRGLTGLVLDGCVRDIDALAQSTIPVWARGHVPSGPHKGWGGAVNVAVQCGGCAVRPNDVILADRDGIMVIPRESVGQVIRDGTAQVAREREILSAIDAGRTTVDLLGLART
ncbi:MAG TPA: RraA family protein [Dongiaceae bacterium]|jgi:RraA family protein|nr:RraA family protein [Dongiaceae bacterium]